VLDQPISQPPKTIEGLPVVILAGEIDLAVAPALRQSLTELWNAGHSDIFVDLLDVTFLDSIALGVLVGALEQCRAAGGDLHLVLTEPRILRVLEITGLANIFTTHSSRDALPRDSDVNLSGRIGQVSAQ
jgi:anti-sigma B factor antagonist